MPYTSIYLTGDAHIYENPYIHSYVYNLFEIQLFVLSSINALK